MITKKFIHYSEKAIYAICYMTERIIYYNLDFNNNTKIFLMVGQDKSEYIRINQS